MNLPEAVASSAHFSFDPGDALPSLSASTAAAPPDPVADASRPGEPYAILYPMKRGARSTQQDDDARWVASMLCPAVPGSPATDPEKHARDLGSTEWVGLTPLAMVQRIVSMAGVASEVDALRALTDPPSAGEKRKRDGAGDDGDDDDDAERLVDHWVARRPAAPRLPAASWTPSSAVDDGPRVEELDDVVAGFERAAAAAGAGARLRLSYDRVQRAFRSRVALGGAANAALAVQRATSQIQALVKMAPSSSGEEGDNIAPLLSSASSSSSSSPSKKGTFQLFMQSWIKDNWQNPYPDDNLSKRLANHVIECGCITLNKKDGKRFLVEGVCPDELYRTIALEKVTNWLVNARTRRWRPSLEAAFDQKRPAALLLEDSLHIYEGTAPRPLAGWDGAALFAFDARYAAPRKVYARKKGARAARHGRASDSGGDGQQAALDDFLIAPFDFSSPGCFAFERTVTMSAEGNRDFPEGEEHLEDIFVAI